MILRMDKLLMGPHLSKDIRPKTNEVIKDAWDDHLMCLVRPSRSFIGRAIWTSSGVGVFFVTPSGVIL